MDARRKRLLAKMPAPAHVKNSKVDWAKLESAVDLAYPPSFKEFIGVYGGSTRCDHATPFFDAAKTVANAKDFRRRVEELLAAMGISLYCSMTCAWVWGAYITWSDWNWPEVSNPQDFDLRGEQDCVFEIAPDGVTIREEVAWLEPSDSTAAFSWPEILEIHTNDDYAFFLWSRHRAE